MAEASRGIDGWDICSRCAACSTSQAAPPDAFLTCCLESSTCRVSCDKSRLPALKKGIRPVPSRATRLVLQGSHHSLILMGAGYLKTQSAFFITGACILAQITLIAGGLATWPATSSTPARMPCVIQIRFSLTFLSLLNTGNACTGLASILCPNFSTLRCAGCDPASSPSKPLHSSVYCVVHTHQYF